MQRICIVGASGASNTTLANKLATKLECPCIDLDELYWGANWQPRPREVIRAELALLLQSTHWVTSGNYKFLRDPLWTAADTLIWLDYALPVVMKRLVIRTLHRVITGEPSVAGNRETIQNSFFSRDSVIWHVVRSSRRLRQEIPTQLALAEYQHLTVLRFASPTVTEAWLQQIR